MVKKKEVKDPFHMFSHIGLMVVVSNHIFIDSALNVVNISFLQLSLSQDIEVNKHQK